jgi:hypothetical protein
MASGPGIYPGLDMVCGGGDGPFWHCRFESDFTMERGGMKVFWKGMITGAGLMLALVLVILAFRFFQERDRKIFETLELRHEIEDLREDYHHRDPSDFLDTPGVRGAIDNGVEQYRKQQDEILQRRRGTGDR